MRVLPAAGDHGKDAAAKCAVRLGIFSGSQSRAPANHLALRATKGVTGETSYFNNLVELRR